MTKSEYDPITLSFFDSMTSTKARMLETAARLAETTKGDYYKIKVLGDIEAACINIDSILGIGGDDRFEEDVVDD